MLSQVGTCHSKKSFMELKKKKLEAPALGTPGVMSYYQPQNLATKASKLP